MSAIISVLFVGCLFVVLPGLFTFVFNTTSEDTSHVCASCKRSKAKKDS